MQIFNLPKEYLSIAMISLLLLWTLLDHLERKKEQRKKDRP
jgi:hypothetical protein